jgi:MFS family permease
MPADMPPSSAPDAATAWPVLALTVGAGVAAAFQVGKVPVALPLLRAELGLDLVTAAWVLSMFNVVGIAVGAVAGALAGGLGARRVVLGGMLLLAAASAAGAAAGGAPVLLASRFVEGLGFILIATGAPTLIVALARPGDLKLAFGVWGTYMPTGQAIMMLLSPAALAAFGWRGVWLGNALLLVVYAAALAAATRGRAGDGASLQPGGGRRLPSPRGLLRDVRETVTARGPLLLALAFGCYTLQYLSLVGFLPTILTERDGVGPAAAGALGALTVAVNILGNLAAGVLLHRGARRSALIAGSSLVMALCAVGVFSLGLPLPATYALCLVFSAVGGMIPATVLGGAPAYAPSPRLVPTANGLVVQGSNIGQTAGPPLVGALAAATQSWAWSPLILGAAAAAGIAAGLGLRRCERREPPSRAAAIRPGGRRLRPAAAAARSETGHWRRN